MNVENVARAPVTMCLFILSPPSYLHLAHQTAPRARATFSTWRADATLIALYGLQTMGAAAAHRQQLQQQQEIADV